MVSFGTVQYPVVTLTGPRQSGKTTLVRMAFPDHDYRSLEEPDHRSFAMEDPRGFLSQFSEKVILDEIQRAPDLFSYIQTIVDTKDIPGRFILTGSQNFLLLQKVSQSLAGRCAGLHLLPFSLSELRKRKPFSVDAIRPHFKNFSKRLIKSPKLYFLDTGLLSYLLRIKSPQDLRYHALYGGIFESFVISEFLKGYMNSGKEHSIYFWRDSTGNEIDVIIDAGENLTPVEIKAGQTVASDFFKELSFWKKLVKNDEQPSALVYGGDMPYVRSNSYVYSWSEL